MKLDTASGDGEDLDLERVVVAIAVVRKDAGRGNVEVGVFIRRVRVGERDGR